MQPTTPAAGGRERVGFVVTPRMLSGRDGHALAYDYSMVRTN